MSDIKRLILIIDTILAFSVFLTVLVSIPSPPHDPMTTVAYMVLLAILFFVGVGNFCFLTD